MSLLTFYVQPLRLARSLPVSGSLWLLCAACSSESSPQPGTSGPSSGATATSNTSLTSGDSSSGTNLTSGGASTTSAGLTSATVVSSSSTAAGGSANTSGGTLTSDTASTSGGDTANTSGGTGGASSSGASATTAGGLTSSSTETSVAGSVGGSTSLDSTSATSGAGGTGGTTGSYRPCPNDGTPCKIMPFGDSITDGYGVAGGYRVELFRLAVEAGKNITFVGTQSNGSGDVAGVPFPPAHEGHSGFTIEPETGRSGISPLVSSVMPQFQPHIVLLMIGTNDAIDDVDMQNAPVRLGTLIDSIYDELPEVLLVVARPIPSREDALNTRLATYGEGIPPVVAARAAAGRHIAVVDMYPVISEQPDYQNQLLQDTWHPNAAGYALIGAEWFRALEAWL